MAKSPAYQWYPKDVMGSQRVALLTLAEEGAYRRALDYCWIHGSIPADPKKLGALIGKGCSTKIAVAVASMFILKEGTPGVLIHDRLEQERQKQKEFSERQSNNGSKGGRPKKPTENPRESDGIKVGYENGNPEKALHSAFAYYKEEKVKKEVRELSINWPLDTKNFLEDGPWQLAFCNSKGLHIETLQTLMEYFMKDLELKSDFKPYRELQRHFTNWFNKTKPDAREISRIKTELKNNEQPGTIQLSAREKADEAILDEIDRSHIR